MDVRRREANGHRRGETPWHLHSDLDPRGVNDGRTLFRQVSAVNQAHGPPPHNATAMDSAPNASHVETTSQNATGWGPDGDTRHMHPNLMDPMGTQDPMGTHAICTPI